jgi:hypothetical protein
VMVHGPRGDSYLYNNVDAGTVIESGWGVESGSVTGALAEKERGLYFAHLEG